MRERVRETAAHEDREHVPERGVHAHRASNLTRRTDFALFMVAAPDDDRLVHEAPAIVGCRSASALAAEAATLSR